MNYSKTHLKLSKDLNSPDILTDPRDFLGPNYVTAINFWLYIDSYKSNQREEVSKRYDIIDYGSKYAAKITAENAAVKAVSNNNVYAAASSASGGALWAPAWFATCELIGMNYIIEEGKSLTFVPLFDFTGNYELHNLDVNDIETRIQRINDFIGPKVEVENDATMTEEDLKSFIEDVELFD